jgi:hypothetical protein
MYKVFLSFFIILLSAQAVKAQCYSMSEFEAEQGLRIHSELMVISLNCQHVHHVNGNLYMQYKDFTRRHSNLISGYERTLKNYFTRTGRANPELAINDLRTSLANKISNDAAQMKPNVFCKAYGNRIIQALQMDQSKLRRWASTPFQGHPVSRPICAAG